jgi:hypothetical protein
MDAGSELPAPRKFNSGFIKATRHAKNYYCTSESDQLLCARTH